MRRRFTTWAHVTSPESVNASDIATRLRARAAEIEDALVSRIRSIEPDAPGMGDVHYEEAQRRAVVAVLDSALASIEHRAESAPAVPSEALTHARRAARSGVELATIIRRYGAANAEFTDFITQEVFHGSPVDPGTILRRIQRAQAHSADRLIATISDEYRTETHRVGRSLEQRQMARIRRLLAGDCADLTRIGYDLDAWHVALVGMGLGVGQALRGVAAGLDSRLLCIACDGQEGVWGWLGGKRNVVQADIARMLRIRWPSGVSLALGTLANGLAGWRETHSQAQDASLVSLYRPQVLTLYSDVALLVPWLRDESRGRWLIRTYLSPLDNGGPPNITLRATLRAYFDAGRNSSVAGNTLKVSRRTIRNRMTLVRQRLGSLVDDRQAELELALRLAEVVTDRSFDGA